MLTNNTVAVALPSPNDSYYMAMYKNLIRFYYDFVQILSMFHEVVIFADSNSAEDLDMFGGLPNSAQIVINKPPCIWLRDWMPILTRKGLVRAEIQPPYISPHKAAELTEWVQQFLADYDLVASDLGLIIDGGNIVLNPERSLGIMTEAACLLNPGIVPEKVKRCLADDLGLERVILIPVEPGDLLAHADGMVRWISPNTLLINSYPKHFRRKLLNIFEQELNSNVNIVELPCIYVNELYRGIPFATGCYINMFLSDKVCVVPTFQDDASDKRAFDIINEYSEIPVFQLDCTAIAKFGGVLNCITWN